MRIDADVLEGIATSLEYPLHATAEHARRAAERAAGDHPEVARALWDLAVYLETTPLGEAEERYCALFDINPACTLHVGYHLFGDTYQRGAFLAGLGNELRMVGLAALMPAELPDYLPSVLRLLGALVDDDSRELLAGDALLPALERMSAALATSASPWGGLLRALPALVAEEAGPRADDTGERPRAAEEVTAHAGA